MKNIIYYFAELANLGKTGFNIGFRFVIGRLPISFELWLVTTDKNGEQEFPAPQ